MDCKICWACIAFSPMISNWTLHNYLRQKNYNFSWYIYGASYHRLVRIIYLSSYLELVDVTLENHFKLHSAIRKLRARNKH